jgi:cysteine desulfurase family protein
MRRPAPRQGGTEKSPAAASIMLYLDNAATSFPKPEVVYRELQDYLRRNGANPGRGGHQWAVRVEKTLDDTRSLLARFFGMDDYRRVIFTLNGTDSLNMAIKGVVRPGDHVVTSLLEHNSVSRPLKQLESDGIISLTQLPFSQEGFIDPDDFRRALTSRTRLVVLLHASNVLGTLQPVAEVGGICRRHEALFLVDAAQTAGILPIDMQDMQIDLLAFPGHKALFGPPGIGVLLVGQRVQPVPWREGGTGFDSEDPVQPRQLPYLLEGGTPNTLGVAALRAGLGFVTGEGLDRIRGHEQRLLTRLIESLRDNPKIRLYGSLDLSRRVGSLALNREGYTASEVGMILDNAFEIAVRPGLHCAPYLHRELGTAPEGAIRISPGYFNTEEDIERCLSALEQL